MRMGKKGLQNIQDNNLQREWGQCRMFSMQM